MTQPTWLGPFWDLDQDCPLGRSRVSIGWIQLKAAKVNEGFSPHHVTFLNSPPKYQMRHLWTEIIIEIHVQTYNGLHNKQAEGGMQITNLRSMRKSICMVHYSDGFVGTLQHTYIWINQAFHRSLSTYNYIFSSQLANIFLPNSWT